MPIDGDIAAFQAVGDVSVNETPTSSLATSTPRDTASPSTDGVVHDLTQISSWKGWAELENDPVCLLTHCCGQQ